MKKEAINSFAKGLIQDMSEQTTTSEGYVDCLNGTLLTNNGNELSLQNDLGNVKLDDVKLKEGFVPVGIKEFGGIIYIASYNPENKKSEIGCFPSPQQEFGGEGASTNLTLYLNDFIQFEDGHLYINKEIQKANIFVDLNGQPRKFYQGDKFKIIGDLTNFAQLLSNNVLTIKLAVLSKSGQLEYFDEQYLNKYEYKVEDMVYTSIIGSEESDYNVFRHKTSGSLVLVIEYKPYKEFQLYRNYEINNGQVEVTFTGSTDINDPQDLLVFSKTDSENKEIIGKEATVGSNGVINYNVYPWSKWGIQKSLKRSGNINTLNVLKNRSSLNKWRYYISDSEVQIDWSFDYFNISKKSINYLEFKFYEILVPTNSSKSLKYTYQTIKEYYSGDFTEYIPININGISKNSIYMCEVFATFDTNDSSKLFEEIVYTGKLFNYVSDEYFDLIRDGDYTIKVSAKVVPKATINIKELSENVYINQNKIHNDTSNNLKPIDRKYNLSQVQNVSWNDFSSINSKQSLENKDEYIFVSEVRKTYGLECTVKAQYADTLDVYIMDSDGVEVDTLVIPAKDALAGELKDYYTITNTLETTIQVDDSNEEQFVGTLDNIPKAMCQITNNNKAITLSRGAYGYGKTKIKYLEMERLMPIYDTSEYVSTSEKNQLFGFSIEPNGNLIAVGGDKDYLCYNTIFTREYHTTGEDKGTKVSGTDDTSLSIACREMGGTINLFGGMDEDAASFKIDNRGRFPIDMNGYGWHKGNEIADEDNFLITCWKTAWDRSKYVLINLASRRDDPRKRVDQMLKCILSQLLIAKVIKANVSYSYPDVYQSSYHDQYDDKFIVKSEVSYTSPNNYEYDDAAQLNVDIIGDNYLPTVEINQSFKIEDNIISIGKDINLQQVTQFYLDEYEGPTKYDKEFQLNDEQRKYIYSGKVNKIDSEGVCTLFGDPISGYKYNEVFIGNFTEGDTCTDSIYFWKNDADGTYEQSSVFDEQQSGNHTLLIPINKQFITKANLEHQYDNLQLNYYNEVLLNEDNNHWYAIGKWAKNGEPAPNMYIDYNFGKKLRVVKSEKP